jgi:hypothetical protein
MLSRAILETGVFENNVKINSKKQNTVEDIIFQS